MKIVSLQSVGLGTYFLEDEDEDEDEYETTYSPTLYIVGERMERVGYFDNDNEPRVTEIHYQHGDFYAYGFEIYTVHTSDGHIRVLPAVKYIAEWSE